MKKKIKEKTFIQKAAHWVIDKKMYFFSLLIGILFLNLVLQKVAPKYLSKSNTGLQITQDSYNEWKESNYDYEKLKILKRNLDKFSFLKPSFEGDILQSLLINDKFTSKEEKLLSSSLDRLKDEMPVYFDYSKNSILISNKNYLLALEKSIDLKNKLLSDVSFLKNDLPAGAVLYTLNLIRIASLYEKLDDKNGERASLKDIEDYLKLNSKDPISNDSVNKAKNTILKIFNENKIELKDYIEYRKSQL